MGKTFAVTLALGMAGVGAISKKMGTVESKVQRLGSAISDLGKTDDFKLGKTLDKQRKAIKRCNDEIKASEKRLEHYNSEQEKAGGKSKELARMIQKEEAALSRLEGRRRSAARVINEHRQRLKAEGRDIKEVTATYSKQSVEVGELTRKQEKLSAVMKQRQEGREYREGLRTSMMEQAAVGYTLAVPVRIAANFEQGMAEVGAVARASDEELKKLSATARHLGATTSFSATEVAAGMKYVSMASFDTNKTIAAMPGLLNLAKAGNVDLALASDIATDTLSAFGMEAGQIGRLGDVLVRTFTSSNTSLEGLGETMKYAAPIAKAARVSLEETATIASLLGDAGIKGSDAGTAMRMSLTRLSAPPVEAAKALEALGVSTKDAEGNLRNVPAIMADIASATQNMGTAERMAFIKDIFGVNASSAMTVLLDKMKEQGLDFNARFKVITESEGAATEVAQKMDATTMGTLKKLTSAMESLAISVGTVALPVVAGIANVLSVVAISLTWLSDTIPGLTSVIGGLATAFVAVPLALNAVRYIGSMIKDGLAIFKVGFSGKGAKGRGGNPGTPLYVSDVSGGGGPGSGDMGGGGSKGGKKGKTRGLRGRVGNIFKGIKNFKLGSALKSGGKLLGRIGPLGAILGAANIAGAAMSGDSGALGGAIGSAGGGAAG
ncbi:MAG TPA: phage tail tape measure protein, partial [Desulfovibrio sp.]|nr:phage tail tape measure protein [Desulfovibrio sp.]